MNIEFKCPYCKKRLEADVSCEADLTCPECGRQFHVPQSIIDNATAESLMDPADPAGAMNYFPED